MSSAEEDWHTCFLKASDKSNYKPHTTKKLYCFSDFVFINRIIANFNWAVIYYYFINHCEFDTYGTEKPIFVHFVLHHHPALLMTRYLPEQQGFILA